MGFIRISNNASEVNRLFLEKLGVSTKRDSDETIGMFGSGSKFAPIAALRRDWRWVNVGTDDRGDYQMEYVVLDQDGLQVIGFDYGDEVRESSFTIDAGVLSWDDEFQIFREAFSNALDAHTEFGAEFSIDLVDEIVHEPGVFAVYISQSPEMLAIIDEIDKYFTFDRSVKFETRVGKILDPYDSQGRFYYKGVLVHEWNDEATPALFDYEFNDLVLNEERRVRNESSLWNKLDCVLVELADKAIVRKFINAMNESHMEFCMPSYQYTYSTYNDTWGEVWIEKYGEDAIPLSPDMMGLEPLIKLYNKKAVQVASDFIVHAVTSTNLVKSATEILGDEAEYQFVDLGAGDQAVFDDALKVASGAVNIDQVTDWRFFNPSGEQNGIDGVANINEKTVYLSYNILYDPVTLVGTIVHEVDHIETGLEDEDRQFRRVADRRIGKLLLQLNSMQNV